MKQSKRPIVISKIRRERRIQAKHAELSLLLKPKRQPQPPRFKTELKIRAQQPVVLKTQFIQRSKRKGRFAQAMSAVAGILVVTTSIFGLLSLTFMNSASAGMLSQIAEKIKKQTQPHTGLVIHSRGTPPALRIPKRTAHSPSRTEEQAQIEAAVDTNHCSNEVKLEEGGLLVEAKPSKRKKLCRLLVHGHDTDAVRSIALGEDGQVVFVSATDHSKKRVATRTFFLFPRRNSGQAWRTHDGKVGLKLFSGEQVILDPQTGLGESKTSALQFEDGESLSRRTGLRLESRQSVVMDFGFVRDGQKTNREFRNARVTIRGPRGGVCLKVKVKDLIEWHGRDQEPMFRLTDSEVEELLSRKCRGLHRLDLSPFRESETARAGREDQDLSESAALLSRSR
jgi:hypothetical protein